VEGIPYVSIDRVISPSIPCVSSDNYGGGVLAAQTLLELGCRRLLFLRIGSHIMGETDKRGSGFLAECANQNVECTVRRFLDEDGPDQVVRLLDEQFLSGPPAYDGVFCSTDMLAVSVVRYLSRRGVRVPEDVQVIGYDGTREFFSGRYVCSTIVQPVQQMAETSVEIVTRWSEAGTPALISIPGFFVPGGTTRDGGTANGQ
jgi:LacI family transcriptional regulator